MKTKMTPLMICHLVLMVLFGLSHIALLVLTVPALINGSLFEEDAQTLRSYGIITAGMSITSIAAICAGILYLVKGYRKAAAGFYKAFMVLAAISTVVFLAGTLFTVSAYRLDGSDTGSADPLYIAGACIMAIKCILLCVLAFAKDLGKKLTWMLFCVLLALDLVYGCFFISPNSLIAMRIIFVMSRLLLDGTIGLAIKGKYDDKAARNTT